MYNHKKIRIAFRRVKLQLCSTLRHTHAEKWTAVSLRLRNEKLCTTRLILFTSCKLIIFGWICLTLIWFYCVCVFFNHIHHVQFCHLWSAESDFFLCAVVCFLLQLHRMWSVSNSPAVCGAGHFTCTVCDSGLLNSARTRGYLVFSKGAWNG